jgi:hypothetical protein
MVARPTTSAAYGVAALREAVSVGAVTGGQATNPLWASQVGNDAFAAALRESLAAHAMLDPSGRRLRVDATLMPLGQPLAGLDLEVTATVFYRVLDVATGRVVFERPIAAAFTATFGDQALAIERLRLANEGAVRANIAAFIAALNEAVGSSPSPGR